MINLHNLTPSISNEELSWLKWLCANWKNYQFKYNLQTKECRYGFKGNIDYPHKVNGSTAESWVLNLIKRDETLSFWSEEPFPEDLVII